jgi:hypothetical protein
MKEPIYVKKVDFGCCQKKSLDNVEACRAKRDASMDIFFHSKNLALALRAVFISVYGTTGKIEAGRA